jgi:hypothetical protein
VFVGIPIGLGFLFYFIPKKLGYPKVAKYLSATFVLLILAAALFLVFQDEFFTKNDAKKLVEEQHIKLNNKFELLKNESSSAMGADYYHTFTLKISEADREQAIQIIKKSKIFKSDNPSIDENLYLTQSRYFGPKVYQDYENKGSYVREYFEPSGQQGYAPTFRRISISKTESKLTFEDIAE